MLRVQHYCAFHSVSNFNLLTAQSKCSMNTMSYAPTSYCTVALEKKNKKKTVKNLSLTSKLSPGEGYMSEGACGKLCACGKWISGGACMWKVVHGYGGAHGSCGYLKVHVESCGYLEVHGYLSVPYGLCTIWTI